MAVRSLFSLASLPLAAARVFVAISASAETLRVRAGEKISAALEKAPPGATIEVEPGVYHETLVVDTPGITEMIGVFIAAVRHPRQFSRNEFNLLGTIAEMAGNAIHRARLYTHSEQQVNRLTALRDVDIAISSSFDLRTTLDVIIDHVINQLKVDAARILLYNPYTQTLDLSVSRGFRSISKQDLHQRLSQSLAGNSALENRMVVLPDIRETDACA